MEVLAVVACVRLVTALARSSAGSLICDGRRPTGMVSAMVCGSRSQHKGVKRGRACCATRFLEMQQVGGGFRRRQASSRG